MQHACRTHVLFNVSRRTIWKQQAGNEMELVSASCFGSQNLGIVITSMCLAVWSLTLLYNASLQHSSRTLLSNTFFGIIQQNPLCAAKICPCSAEIVVTFCSCYSFGVFIISKEFFSFKMRTRQAAAPPEEDRDILSNIPEERKKKYESGSKPGHFNLRTRKLIWFLFGHILYHVTNQRASECQCSYLTALCLSSRFIELQQLAAATSDIVAIRWNVSVLRSILENVIIKVMS